ncbi:multidrug effflux MFS transporter [Pusillimonas sp. CC-YST705]|uniref:Bcr/CflA family efflux transporter n=1 Tax=Mesopusillimonas faecipullorum TaxID=2755040 RepID=A0ABS8C8G5_9BURK|nr:multidrug effflux MFS transporter [Mesopusillimonas faecipullorum]MCB5362310.1 multidrug effflux MFS transporter [Mesopusillimonas faecipullorum]
MTSQTPSCTSASHNPPLWGLALLTFSGTLAMHIFIPALPAVATALHATASQMQLTITWYIIGLAVGQLIYGPLSDRFGRRPPLLAGLALYTVASFAALFASNAQMLIATRLLAALGGCAGMVLGRVIVRDTTRDTRDTAGRLALMNIMVVIGPGLAPTVGGLLAAHTGWRSIFAFLTLLGIANICYTWWLLPETRPVLPARRRVSPLREYWTLLGSRKYLGFALGGGLATTSIYAVVAAAPFVLSTQLGRPTSEVGIYLTLIICAMVIGYLLARVLLRRFTLKAVLLGSNFLSLLSAGAMLLCCVTGYLNVLTFILPAIVYSIAAGLTSPGAAAQAISVKPRLAGAASGLYGCGQMVIGAVCTVLAGLGTDHALSAALTLCASGLIGQWMLRGALIHRVG